MSTPKELAILIREDLEDRPSAALECVKDVPPADVAEALNCLTVAESAMFLAKLPVAQAIRLCDQPNMKRRAAIFEQLEPKIASALLEGIAADQRTVVLEQISPHERGKLLPLLSNAVRAETQRLLQYPSRTAGNIMTTEFVRLAPDMTVAAALKKIRGEARDRESIYACYVLDPANDQLLGAISLRDLVMAELSDQVANVMRKKPISVKVSDEQEKVAQKISRYNLLAIPVLETDGKVVGFVTVDDVIDVMVEEQTDDILRLGAIEPGAIDESYINTPFLRLMRMRAVWLVILFLSEMLTATAMGFFEGEIAKAVVLALFVPLIISSGGNSGSQASTLIIRAMALGEIRISDWWRVMKRELLSGLALGALLGTIGFLRIAIWTIFTPMYGEHWALIGMTVSFSLLGIVMWGTLAGSMLPLLLRRLGLDPATSSAPFVATLVDVTGLIIYFSVAMVILRGTLL